MSTIVFGLLAMPAMAAEYAEVCIENASQTQYLFAATAPAGERVVSWLKPGQRLCSRGAARGNGVVSVYVGEKALEGCSRLLAAGETERLIRYAEFDRCTWSSHR